MKGIKLGENLEPAFASIMSQLAMGRPWFLKEFAFGTERRACRNRREKWEWKSTLINSCWRIEAQRGLVQVLGTTWIHGKRRTCNYV